MILKIIMTREMQEKEEVIEIEDLKEIVTKALDDHKTIFKRLSEI